MMSLKVRFAILVCGFLVLIVGGHNLSLWFRGLVPMTFTGYLNQVFWLSVIAVGAWGLFSLAIRLLQQHTPARQTILKNVFDQFEPVIKRDIPAMKITAPPAGEEITQLERELLGYWYGFRHWPRNLTDASMDAGSLGDFVLQRWQRLQDKPENQRIAALCIGLGRTIVWQEQHQPAKWWQVWLKDQVSFKQRADYHSGHDVMVLQKCQAFRRLAADHPLRVQIPIALRYRAQPNHLPLNVEEETRALCRFLNTLDERKLRNNLDQELAERRSKFVQSSLGGDPEAVS